MSSSTYRTLAVILGLAAAPSAALAQTTPPEPPPNAPAQPSLPAAPTEPPAVAPPPAGTSATAEPPPAPAPAPTEKAAAKPPSPAVTSKWAAQLYGFVEFDGMYDSTESLTEVPGNTNLVRPGTYEAAHRRMQFSARNSRLGFRLSAPEFFGVKASALLELDFFGANNTTEAPLYVNPTFRFRHAALKIETPILDILAGQYWQLFGFQSYFQPNTVELQGVPGEVYSRSPQFRLTKIFKTDPINIEIAAAASRPPQRDAARPDGQAGLKLSINPWKGVHTVGSTGTSVDSAAIAVSGLYRRFDLKEFSAAPVADVATTGWGYSVDAMLPIIPADNVNERGNALTFTGSFVRGDGIADLYTGLTGGIAFPALAGGGAYTPNVDNGLVTFASDGTLHAIGWQSFILGLQYYLPPSGKLWIAANYSLTRSPNAAQFGTASKVWDHQSWVDGLLMWDATPAIRFGVEFAHTEQIYADKTTAWNNRYQLSAFYIF